MPAIDFPAAPAVNDEYSFEGRTWLWNGTGWEVKSYPAALQLGSATAPSLYFTGDTNTGLYSPGADQVALTTAGAQKFTIDSLDGNAIIENSFPTTRPSLDLPFALTKTLDPRITFTRASSATYVDSAGLIQTASTDVPRFDHNPVTGESLGLLVEEQRTNLVLRSEEFDDASWTKVRASITANSIAAPSGTITADTGVEDASASATHNPLIQDATIIANGTYTASLYVKAKERSRGDIWFSSIDSANYVAGSFNLGTGTISAANVGTGSGAVASIANVGNGWYRVSVTGSIGGSLTTGRLVLRLADSTGSIVYTGDGTSGIYLWGAQLEAGAFATSYIPTTTAAVTRSADVCSISGSNFSSWYRQDEGTMFAGYNIPFDSSTSIFPIIAGSSDNTFNNVALLYARTIDDGRRAAIRNGGVGQFDQANAGAYAFGTNSRSAFAFATNNVALSVAGAAPTAGTTATIPTVDRLTLGSTVALGGALSPLNGTIQRFTYWGQRLSNSTLQAITQ